MQGPGILQSDPLNSYLLIRHFRLIRRGNLKTLKALSLTPMLNYPLNSSPRLVHHKISAYFSDELSGSNCILRHNSQIYTLSCVQGTGYITCVKTKNSFYVTKSQMSSGPFFLFEYFQSLYAHQNELIEAFILLINVKYVSKTNCK